MGMAEKMRLLAMKGLFRPKQIQPKLDLFFDEFDFNVQRLSSSLKEIVSYIKKDNIFDIWADPSVDNQEISDIFGTINEENILRIPLSNGERIVRRDGIVLK